MEKKRGRSKMLTLFIYSFIFIMLSMNVIAKDCKIKMAKSGVGLGKPGQKLIYNEGAIEDEEFKENALKPYTTSNEDTIEYFYIFEQKAANHGNHDKVKTLITSHDSSVLEVKSQISNSNSEYQDSFDMNEVEVIFTCKPGKTGKAKVSMVVQSDQCDPFTIEWQKECSPQLNGAPNINIGLTRGGSEVVKGGKYVLSTGHDTENKMTLDKDTHTISLYLTSVGTHTYKMKKPELIFNEDNVVSLFKGDLQTGGSVNADSQSFTLALACKENMTKSSTDIQLKMMFDDNLHVCMFFSKECDTTDGIQSYFTVIKFVYWLLIILIVIFIVVIALYYLKKNELTVYEAVDRIKDYIDSRLFGHRKLGLGFINREVEAKHREDRLFEDDQNLDIKISTHGGETELKNAKAGNIDYGGI